MDKTSLKVGGGSSSDTLQCLIEAVMMIDKGSLKEVLTNFCLIQGNQSGCLSPQLVSGTWVDF